MKLFPYLLGSYRLDECGRYPEFFCESNIGAGIGSYECSLFSRKFCLSCITTLFCYCGPAAITRLISRIVIDTLKGETSGFLAHVGKKILEAVQPSLTDFYAAITVISRHRMPVLGAPGFHVNPSDVSFSTCTAVSRLRSTQVHDSSSTERLWKVTGQCLSTGPLRFVA